jgi:hypothetical protein
MSRPAVNVSEERGSTSASAPTFVRYRSTLRTKARKGQCKNLFQGVLKQKRRHVPTFLPTPVFPPAGKKAKSGTRPLCLGNPVLRRIASIQQQGAPKRAFRESADRMQYVRTSGGAHRSIFQKTVLNIVGGINVVPHQYMSGFIAFGQRTHFLGFINGPKILLANARLTDGALPNPSGHGNGYKHTNDPNHNHDLDQGEGKNPGRSNMIRARACKHIPEFSGLLYRKALLMETWSPPPGTRKRPEPDESTLPENRVEKKEGRWLGSNAPILLKPD